MENDNAPNDNSRSASFQNDGQSYNEEIGMIYLLVIAHPDDESMFFLPSLRHILECQDKDNGERVRLQILCLSNGNYDGLGLQREKEIFDAVKVLEASMIRNNVSDHNHELSHRFSVGVTVVNDDRLQDGPYEKWEPNIISQVMDHHIQKLFHQSTNYTLLNKDRTVTSAFSSLTILTFDKIGISHHPNHIDTYHGVCAYLNHNSSREQTETKHPDFPKVIRAWEIVSMENIIAKYIPIWIFFYYIWSTIWIPFFMERVISNFSSTSNKKHGFNLWEEKVINEKQGEDETRVYFMFQPRLVWNAMAAHNSQFVWYRRLSVLFSSYTYMNILTTIKPKIKESKSKHV